MREIYGITRDRDTIAITSDRDLLEIKISENMDSNSFMLDKHDVESLVNVLQQWLGEQK